ncbi:MAG: fimbrillin family protein [Bacteroidales bacterium]|nr:fimbrillin family protein [Bacteroidales bacterium]
MGTLKNGAEFGKEISFTASTDNFTSNTKSGDYTTVLSSEAIGSDSKGNTLYLTAIQNEWPIELSSENNNSVSDIASKASVITTSDIINHSIGIMAYKYAASAAVGSWALHQAPMEATYNTGLAKWIPATIFYWVNAGNKMRFYSYAPYEAVSTTDISASDGAYPTATFTVNSDYSAQKDLLIANIEVNDNPTFDNICQPLSFNHALSAVRFKIAKEYKDQILNITISNVNSKATLNMHTLAWSGHSTLANFAITDSGNLTTKSETGDYVSLDDKYTLMMLPTTSAGQLSGAKITVTFTDATVIEGSIGGHKWEQGKIITYLISKNISDASGKTFVFTATNPTDIDYSGWESTTGSVTSYSTTDPIDANASLRTPVEWRVEGYYKTQAGAASKTASARYNGINATFLKSFPARSDGSVTPENLTISYTTVKPNVTTKDKGAARNAKIVANSATLKGNANSPWNICSNAQDNTVKSTANTYIINGAGYYKFPLVMGNGVKADGSLNTEAYPSNFKDYKGAAIESPYLHKSSSGVGVPYAAVLSWADYDFIEIVDKSTQYTTYRESSDNISKWYLAGGIIGATNGISSTGSGDNLVYWCNFYVPKATCTKQGIATIVIKDADNVTMWSYLIWLTDFDLATKKGVDENGNEEGNINIYPLKSLFDTETIAQTMMPRNLGWVEDGVQELSNFAASDVVWVRLEQQGNPSSATNYKVIKLQRPAAQTASGTIGHNPYFQMGRPFAMKPAGGSGNDEPKLFGYFRNTTYTVSGYSSSSSDLGSSIRNAQNFITSTQNRWHNESTAVNFWHATNTEIFPWDRYDDCTSPIKTIYDPCPAGYKMPRFAVFTGFLNNDTKKPDRQEPTNYFYSGRPNVKGTFEYGYNFYVHHYLSTDVVPESEQTIFFPASGCRLGTSGSIANNSKVGLYYLCVSQTNNGVGPRLLQFGRDFCQPQSGWANGANAFAVRPVLQASSEL